MESDTTTYNQHYVHDIICQMSSVEEFPEHIVATMEHGAVQAAAIVLFGILLFVFAFPVVGEYARDTSLAATHEAASDEGGGGGHGH